MANRELAKQRWTPRRVLPLVAVALVVGLLGIAWWNGGGANQPDAVPGSSTSSGPASRAPSANDSPETAPTARKSPPPTWRKSPTPTTRTRGQAPATDRDSGLRWIEASALPPQARDTLELIDAGGPFPYPDRDGVTFRNDERILPREERGYYREYTVKTPGSQGRGARRIVTGEGGEFYWTKDHYQTFERIRR